MATKLFTPSQVAEILQVSVWTVKRWLQSGELPGVKLGPGGHWRVRSDMLQDYVQQQGTITKKNDRRID